MKIPFKTIFYLVLLLAVIVSIQYSFTFSTDQFAQADTAEIIEKTRKPRVLLFAIIGLLSALIVSFILKKRKNKS